MSKGTKAEVLSSGANPKFDPSFLQRAVADSASWDTLIQEYLRKTQKPRNNLKCLSKGLPNV
jgi:hypothetical protein